MAKGIIDPWRDAPQEKPTEEDPKPYKLGDILSGGEDTAQTLVHLKGHNRGINAWNVSTPDEAK